MASLEDLKSKYEDALETMEENGVVLVHMNMDGGKLFIQGTAPSEDAKNEVWDKVKSIDPSYSDLTLDLTVSAVQVPDDLSVDPEPPPLDPPANVDASVGQAPTMAPPYGDVPRTYTVQVGDTLSKIAKKFYGRADEYSKIFEGNRDVLQSPNLIRVGQELKIP